MYIIRSLPIVFLYVVHFIFPSEVQLCILSIIYSIHILTFQKKWNSLTLSTSGWTWSSHAERAHREISSLPKPRWGVQPSPAVSNVRLLLTDEGEAPRLREPGTVSATALPPPGEETGQKVGRRGSGTGLCGVEETNRRSRVDLRVLDHGNGQVQVLLKKIKK